jgi:hypothetical protein
MVHPHVGLRIADLMIWRVAGKILNKQLSYFISMIFSKQMREAGHVAEG